MKIDSAAVLAAPVGPPQAGTAEVLQQIAHRKGRRNDTPTGPGLLSRRQGAPEPLPDARSRLGCNGVADQREGCDLLASLGF